MENKSILVREDKNSLIEKEEQLQVNKDIPLAYIPINLPSNGQLGYPSLIHVRNFSTENISSILILDDASAFEGTIRTLQHCIWEEIDPYLLHQEDALFIMIQIISNWWSPTITLDYPYVESEIEELKLLDDLKYENIHRKITNGDGVTVDFPIKKLKVKTIKKEFKAPFKMFLDKEKSTYVEMDLNRLSHLVLGRQFIDEKFEDEDNKSAIIRKKGDIHTLSSKEKDYFLKYSNNKTVLFSKVLQSQVIKSFNGEPISSIEGQLDLYDEYLDDAVFWKKYQQIVDEYSFGYEKDLKIKSPLTNESTVRRFYFRPSTFIQNLKLPSTDQYDFSFD